jgi:hypothetical protein
MSKKKTKYKSSRPPENKPNSESHQSYNQTVNQFHHQATSQDSVDNAWSSSWQPYGLDRAAQKLVITAKGRDPDSLNQSHKMRMATAYGLERFWGEQIRLQDKEKNKSAYWRETWSTLVELLKPTGILLPNDNVDADDLQAINTMSQKLWAIPPEDQRVALAILTQLCDCLVWWTQRYK